MTTLSLLIPTVVAVAMHNPLAQPEAVEFDVAEIHQQIELRLDQQMQEMQRQQASMDVGETLELATQPAPNSTITE
ncbi:MULTISPECIES: hypothetical protein [Ferrimonas]|uniref:hypothetical protein n=1 Tax=Ferrimonas TaxID=44011 RepID=UPI00041A44E7|nr:MULTISPECIES: hypothetical protein [Ferrimonas]USD38265.1 hypothetical protein J8Z22_03715 [Ferrimonas sp. SCSIO 43195]